MTLIDLATDSAGAPITVGKNPQSITMSPDGTTAWVVCYDRTLVPLSTRTNLPGTAIHLPGGPYADRDDAALHVQPNGDNHYRPGGQLGLEEGEEGLRAPDRGEPLMANHHTAGRAACN